MKKVGQFGLGIPTPQGGGFVQNVWREFRTGGVTADERDRLVALHTSASLSEHKFRELPPMAADVFNYCNDRDQKKIAREAERAEKNGVWLHIMSRLMGHNEREITYLTWAAEKCDEAGKPEAAFKIRDHMKLIEAVPYNQTEYSLGRRVQKMDSDDARRSLYSNVRAMKRKDD